jgi:hypothetical protein
MIHDYKSRNRAGAADWPTGADRQLQGKTTVIAPNLD